jgi:uncharacterized damage-inducible protein DinB
MEASERAYVLDRLTENRGKLLDSVNGLTVEQWEFRPAGGRWSIADCVEHIVLVESRILKSIGKVLDREPQPEKKADAAGKDAFLKDGTALDRSRRFNTPAALEPKKTWKEPSALLSEFESTRVRTIEFILSSEGDLRSHFFQHIAFGDLDCYQWLMLLPVHCERHMAQIEEIKSEAGFPHHSFQNNSASDLRT